MTKVAALELAPHGIRVNSIHPGVIDPGMLKEDPAVQATGTRARELLLARIPMNRFGAAGEVAALAAYLASDEAPTALGRSSSSTAECSRVLSSPHLRTL